MARVLGVEVNVAVYKGAKGGGEWHTDYVEIPATTPEGEIEDTAIAAYWDSLPDSAEVAHVWFAGVLGEGDEDEDEDTTGADEQARDAFLNSMAFHDPLNYPD